MNYLLLGVSIVSILIMSLGGVVLPLWLGGVGKWNGLVIDVLTYFTGGVFLGAGMLHMLPDAVEDAKQAGGIADAALMNPFITFCLGYILVYAIEQMQHRELKKHSVLAVAQRARSHSATASICIVDVPPVTTYHASDGTVLPKLSGLLAAEQSGSVEPSTLRHSDRSYSHGSGPGSPHMHGHGHAHAAAVHTSHDHGHGNGGSHDGCAHDGCAHDHDEDASTGDGHEHGHAGHAGHASHDHGHADHAGPSPSRRVTVAPPTSPVLAPLRLPPSHGHTGSTPPGSPHAAAAAAAAPPPQPPTPSRSRRPSFATSSNGWVDESECCGGHGGPGGHAGHNDHGHVHTGVRHKHVSVGGMVGGGHGHGLGGAATLPLILALLFSVHSFIAGLALGIQSSHTSSAVSILVAILGHKLVEALSLASSFVREGVSLSTSASVLAVYCLMTPLGIVAGASVLELGSEATKAEALISGFAAGSFVFLAAHELTTHASTSVLSKTMRSTLALGGMCCMAVLAIWT